MAKEYIEREALQGALQRKKASIADKRYTEGWNDCMMRVKSMVHAAHAANVVEVVHGRWYWDADNETGHNIRRCSVCHSGSGWAFNYCPNCGARMDGE